MAAVGSISVRGCVVGQTLCRLLNTDYAQESGGKLCGESVGGSSWATCLWEQLGSRLLLLSSYNGAFQIGKLRSELEMVSGNVRVMSEMLTELVPTQVEPADLELLQVSKQLPARFSPHL